ncbi:MAG: histidine--tRNA ligase [candidate division KSB1 bacterium]|nr:histidine--tRNA ligase [candidate division KSB1 bacterium]
MARFKAVRGTRDVLPEEWPYWEHIERAIGRVTSLYGYKRIATPILEETGLYVRGVGQGTDIVDKEMYTFQDRGGRSLSLRPEFTAGIMRAYLENGLHVHPKPVKLYAIGPIFRYERPEAGRYRQHTQFNVEAIGEQDPALDFEVIALALHLFREIGISGTRLQLNSTGCPRCRPQYVRRLVEYYKPRLELVCSDCRRRYERNPLRLLDCKVEQCQPVIAQAPDIREHLCGECREHFEALLSYLEAAAIPYEVNRRLVRGLDYYTKTVFEVWVQGIGSQNAICGGGRYDGLIEELGGPPTPGIGFGSGMERLVLTLQEQNVAVATPQRPAVFAAYLGPEAKRAALEIVQALRAEGIPSLISFGERSLKAQLRDAHRAGACVAIVLGEEELRDGQIQLKWLDRGEQARVDRNQLIPTLRQELAQSRL